MMRNLFFILLFFVQIACSQKTKINGISFVASDRPIEEKAIKPLLETNANWITLMPFAFMKSLNETTIHFNFKNQWLGEREEGITQTASAFHEKGIKIMLKPQIWISNGNFTGHIKMNSDADWDKLEEQYEAFILFYAKIAETTHCEMFCIGTELHSFVDERPEFWKALIVKIREKYKGKITYAENWDTYEKTPFVNQLDYIGIDAYFPLASSKTPSLSELEASWKPLLVKLENFSNKHQKQILFTEFGYQSTDYTTKEPWNHSNSKTLNLEAQTNATQALFDNVWQNDWFAGGFLWKWYDDHTKVGGLENADYTPQNKPVEKVIQEFYK